MFVLLVGVAMLASCSDDRAHNDTAPWKGVDGSALVKLEVRVPGGTAASSRALQPQHENEVEDIIVLAFEKGVGDNWDTKLKYVGKMVGGPEGEGTKKRFTVELLSGEWDLWVLANSQDIIDDMQQRLGNVYIYSPEFLEMGLKKSDFQTAATKMSVGKWNADPTDVSGAYRIPMWGMINAVRVQTSSNDIIKTVNLYRMLSKIDVEVQRAPDAADPTTYPGIPDEQFELTYVSLHNYNRVGRLIPGVLAEDGDWTADGGGRALQTSLPTVTGGVYGWQSDKRQEWGESDMTTSGTALEGVIYTFEADAGVDSDERPCIIIGGRYNGSNEITYYRADFLDRSNTYLSLLRNHRYKFLIRKIGGKGFPSVEAAYEAGPTNIEAEVIEWNEGGYVQGVWNGTYEIRLSETKAHFTQFGQPSPQVITLRTNVPSLTFGSFTNISTGAGDGVWTEAEAGRWTNGHFEVTIKKTLARSTYSEYSMTVTAKPSVSGDPARKSIFKINGYMLEVEIVLTQDYHVLYRLTTLPSPINPIGIDGAQQRLKIAVTSTHPYMVDLKDNPMFLGVYAVATGGTPINKDYIPETITTLYVEVGQHTDPQMRVGDFIIKHVSSVGSAPARVYSILQLTPAIDAELADGGFLGQMQKGGGRKVINVTSNLAGWYPVLTINGITYSGDLSNFFSVVNGVHSQQVVFTIPPMSDSETGSKVYAVKFRDRNNIVETDRHIVIVQKTIDNTPPTGGVKAPSGILAVNSEGKLNLDGDGYIVYFKWGSLVAVAGSSTAFDGSQIAWAPDAYDTSVIGDDWAKVPYADATNFPVYYPMNIPAAGLGDPCSLALKDGVAGGWKMPSGTNWFETLRSGSADWVTEQVQTTTVYGRWNTLGNQFYPAAGYRDYTGLCSGMDTGAYYWGATSAGSTTARYLYFAAGTMGYGYSGGRTNAYAIRCMPK